jgi:hypothetical protein
VAARTVGIDLGAQVVWAVAAEGRQVVAGDTFGVDPGELARLRAWCADASAVAIDAPAGPSEGRHVDDAALGTKFRPARCAEVALGRAGYWVSWVTGAGPHKPWMEVGFAVYAALDDLAPVEVFPFAVFAELLGRRPPRKDTLLGRRARLDALRTRLELPATAALWGHDGIDAAGACVVAADVAAGRARRVACGDHEGSAMFLPGRSGRDGGRPDVELLGGG